MLLPAHDWLSTRLSHPLEALPSDILHRQPAHTRPATVLIPLLWRPDAPAIVLTQRKTGLRHHAGQISFPGGKLEPDDASARRHLSTSERRAEFT
ncbi:NUDIX domain-containing protein [Rivihabitans pingtungensis]|mgnify:FL=1|uniref:NUDIX domain-containing protein n=1 Tax=Rivihabitans pingtungensis TaxID=1054498 RepID=UPI0023F38EDE|nr:NUDIX domain-containing protein [Rivihabitans pingtungensis]